MKDSIIISITLIVIFIFIFINPNKDLKLIEKHGQRVLVRDAPDKEQSAELLAKLIIKMYKLRQILIDNINKYPEYAEYILLLKNNFNQYRTKIYENAHNSEHTSYSINKGEEFVFCLRCKKDNSLHSLNLLFYVAVHEMAHAGCPEIGHTKLFNKIFRFFLSVAVEHNLYVYENYSENPVEYCGLRLYTNILN